MNVKNVQIEKLLPRNVKEDSFLTALSKGVNDILQPAGNQIFLIPRIGKVNDLSEEMLDEIAYENNIFWYYKDDPLKTKKATIQNFRRVQNSLGTPWAIQNVLYDIYGEAELVEFFDEKAEDLLPHEFSVYVVSQSTMNEESKSRLYKRIKDIKRASSVMKQIFTVDYVLMNYKVGMIPFDHMKDEIVHITNGSNAPADFSINNDMVVSCCSFNNDYSEVVAENPDYIDSFSIDYNYDLCCCSFNNDYSVIVAE